MYWSILFISLEVEMEFGINDQGDVVVLATGGEQVFRKDWKCFASYKLNQYANGVITYITSTNPTATLATANQGVARGLPR